MRLTPACVGTVLCDRSAASGRVLQLAPPVTGKRRRPVRIALALLVWIAAATAVTGQLELARAETFGKTTVGASTDNGMFANYKIVHKATLSVPGTITKLSVYAVP
ncbi:MAG TPA: hypothetical protein VGY54_03945, partial [Polyangiaceae bacterium]|nr:hypothetical protein [Polyangiaceae bacterium]